MPSESIDMVVCSPPYWALRAYNSEPQIWDGNENCNHEFSNRGKNSSVGNNNPEIQATRKRTLKHKRGETTPGKEAWYKENGGVDEVSGAFCDKCGVWRGELGLEPNPEMYIKHLICVFDEVKRVLKKQGSCWVVIGDTYMSGGGTSRHKGYHDPKYPNGRNGEFDEPSANKHPILKPKSLCLIPYRFALSMIDNGWTLRNNIIWKKPNCIPSSAKDRFTVDYENVFFFTKSKKYYFEQQFEPYTNPLNRWGAIRSKKIPVRQKDIKIC